MTSRAGVFLSDEVFEMCRSPRELKMRDHDRATS